MERIALAFLVSFGLDCGQNLRGLRYDQYFIFDSQHRYVLFPAKSEFEGVNKRVMQDANGKYLVRELVALQGIAVSLKQLIGRFRV